MTSITNNHPQVRNELYITRARLVRILETQDHVQHRLWKVTNFEVDFLITSYSHELEEFALFKASEDGKILDYNPVYSLYESSHDEIMQLFCDFNSGRLLREVGH